MFKSSPAPSRKFRYTIAVTSLLSFLALAHQASAQLTLTWKDNSHNEAGFSVERSLDGKSFGQIAKTGPNVTSYTDNDTKEGVTYHYRVRAFNHFGYSGSSNTRSAKANVKALAAKANALVSSIIGGMSKKGDSLYDSVSGIFQLSASGRGHEPLNDELRYTFVEAGGNLRIAVKVHDFNPDAGNASIGIMLRSSSKTNARHASIGIDGFGRFESLVRSKDGGKTTTKSGPATGSSGFLALEKNGDTITLSHSRDGRSWTTLNQPKIAFPSRFQVGLALGSAKNGQLSGAVVEVVETRNLDFGFPTPQPTQLKAPTSAIVGPMSTKGASIHDPETNSFQLSASGVGYETVHDALRYTYVEATGDGRIAVKVHAYKPDGPWSRVGIMLRSSLKTDARHVSIALNGNRNFESLIRSKDGAKVATKSAAPKVASGYLALEKLGDTIALSYSVDGSKWTTLQTTKVAFGSKFLVGIQIGSETNGKLSSSVVEVVESRNFKFGYRAHIPGDPSHFDFATKSALTGPMKSPGKHSFNSQTGLYSISASGLGFEPVKDALRLSYLEKSGDAEIVVRIKSFKGDASLARAGLTIRQSLAADSRHATIAVNGKNSVESLYRAQDGKTVTTHSGAPFAPGTYLRIRKSDDKISLGHSANLKDWTTLNQIQIDFGPTYLIGLVIGSQADGKLSTATLELVDFK